MVPGIETAGSKDWTDTVEGGTEDSGSEEHEGKYTPDRKSDCGASSWSEAITNEEKRP